MTSEEIMNIVRPAICAQLKCPASAVFPPELIYIVGNEMQGYQINGFVDSQNSYGAMIRNDFTAQVVLQNGFPMVVSSSVGKKAAMNSMKQFGANYIALTILSIVGGIVLTWAITMAVGM